MTELQADTGRNSLLRQQRSFFVFGVVLFAIGMGMPGYAEAPLDYPAAGMVTTRSSTAIARPQSDATKAAITGEELSFLPESIGIDGEASSWGQRLSRPYAKPHGTVIDTGSCGKHPAII